MKNLYEVLNINKDSDEKEIKDRYMTLVRKYPPEKQPEKFAEIREAYEILSDSKRKREHDLELEIALEKENEKLRKLEDEADIALEKGDYRKAIDIYKKILKKNKDSESIKNKLGKAFLNNHNLKEAKEIFEDLIAINNNFEYNYNLSKVYILYRNYEKAEEYLYIAKEKNPSEGIILELIDLEMYLENYEKAEKIIQEFLNKYPANNKIVQYILILVKKYIGDDNESKIYRLLIKNIDKIDINLNNNIKLELNNLVYKLYYVNMMDSAKKLSNRMIELGCKNLEGILFEENNNCEINLKEEFFKFVDDTKIIELLKEPIIFSFVKYENDIFSERKKDNINEIKKYINSEPEWLVESIKLLKEKYENLYLKISKVFENIEYLANKNIEYRKYDLIKNNQIEHTERFDEQNNKENNVSNQINEKFEEIDVKIDEGIEKLKENISNGLEKGMDIIKKKSIYDIVNDVSPKLVNKLERFVNKNKNK